MIVSRRWTILTSLLLSPCGDILSPESAMPGAYMTPCASEPIRYIPIFEEKLVLKIPQGTVAPGSTGAVVWNSGILLKRLVECLIVDGTIFPSSQSQDSSTILELGCGGTGLVSAVLAKSGVFQTVVASDGNPEMIQQVQQMAKLNDLYDSSTSATKTNFHSAVYQWGSYDTGALSIEHFDWIVGADLTYNPASWLALADSMATLSDRCLYLTLGHGGSAKSELASFLTAASDRIAVDEAMSKQVRNVLLTRCLSSEERAFVDENGGVSVVVLRSRVI